MIYSTFLTQNWDRTQLRIKYLPQGAFIRHRAILSGSGFGFVILVTS